MSPSRHRHLTSSRMATQSLRSICSIFYRQSPKKKEAHSFRTDNRVFGDWATSAVEDVPPPYTDSPESNNHLHDEKHSSPPPFPSPRLQICPHESLSFENLQKATNFRAATNRCDPIDALTLSCHDHRSHFEPASKNARNVCTSSPGLLVGSGTYASEDAKDDSHTPGVVLCFHWDLGFLDGIRGQVETALEFQHFLGADGIWLCPHKQISDSDVINAIFSFVKRPSGRNVITSCGCCDSVITILTRTEGGDETCRVTTKRYLGALEKPDDPTWLAQCGV